MINFTRKNKESDPLEKEIRAIFDELENCQKNGEDYGVLLERLEKLHSIRNDKKCSDIKIDPNKLIGAAANLAGILLILNYEKANVLATKAVSFVLKGRV